ncbi:hypothetical protein BH11PLA2_BH11PLA2_04830 [soil metagenome]
MSELKSRTRWPSLFQQSLKPIFVLNRSRRIRFVNEAWEKLTKTTSEDALGRACILKGPTEPLYRAFAPPSEAVQGRIAKVRRPAPPNKNGPPWWDVTFIPLATSDAAGYLGIIEVVAPSPVLPLKSVPASLGTLRAKQAEAYTYDLFAGSTLSSQRLQSLLRHAAGSSAPVWISGEAGSGKTTAARVIHHNGPRRDRPFVTLDCAGLQPYLIDGLLWGTGGVADRVGTLHLKSPAALPRDLQQKLADWAITTADAPRLICTSTVSAASSVTDGSLCDIYAASLAVIEIAVPPLRERISELSRIAANVNPEVIPLLAKHSWPGNLRELIEVLNSTAEPLTVATLPRFLKEKSLLSAESPAKPPSGLDAILETVERKLIVHAMETCKGNATEAATRLGIPRARLMRRLEVLGLKANA